MNIDETLPEEPALSDARKARRRFLQAAAATGVAAAVWADPVVRSSPAYAQTGSINGSCSTATVNWVSGGTFNPTMYSFMCGDLTNFVDITGAKGSGNSGSTLTITNSMDCVISNVTLPAHLSVTSGLTTMSVTIKLNKNATDADATITLNIVC